jgi:hypothetical protein
LLGLAVAVCNPFSANAQSEKRITILHDAFGPPSSLKNREFDCPRRLEIDDYLKNGAGRVLDFERDFLSQISPT